EAGSRGREHQRYVPDTSPHHPAWRMGKLPQLEHRGEPHDPAENERPGHESRKRLRTAFRSGEHADEHAAGLSLTQGCPRGTNGSMSMLGAVKDVFVNRAMRLMSDPRLSRVIGDPRVMNAAMKAVSLGGSVKNEFDRASRFAAGLLGL